VLFKPDGEIEEVITGMVDPDSLDRSVQKLLASSV